ncbi:hypothetical protein J6590_060637 [Homalodisca vitripennis]|nr:hypothetical protein J6590_060637 [Homalodisca vitripennis]
MYIILTPKSQLQPEKPVYKTPIYKTPVYSTLTVPTTHETDEVFTALPTTTTDKTCHASFDHLCQHINPQHREPNKPLNNLSTLQTLIHQQMVAELLPFFQRQQPDRNRRSLTFVGDFFEWCCDIATEHQIRDLVDNEKEITQNTNAIIHTVDTDHQDLLLITNIIKNYSDGASINGPYRHPPTSFTIYKENPTFSQNTTTTT